GLPDEPGQSAPGGNGAPRPHPSCHGICMAGPPHLGCHRRHSLQPASSPGVARMNTMNQGWSTLVDVPRLAAALNEDNLRLLDARATASTALRVVDTRFSLADVQSGAAQYAAGHIPGAVYADLNRDLSDLGRQGHGRHPLPDSDAFAATLGRWGITPDTQVVAYDAADGSMAAARLWWLLRLLGHRNVAVLDGGLAAWQAAGHALQP